MKITEKDLLQAIGNADEKTIEQAAPQQFESETVSSVHLPRLCFRRVPELIAVCAAVCICIGGILLIHRLHSADMRTFSSPEEQAAYTALREFLDDCVDGDREKILQAQLEPIIDLWEDDMYQSEEELDVLTKITDYKIGECTQDTDFLWSGEYTERSYKELIYYYYLDKGETEKAEEWRTTNNEWLKFFHDCDLLYVFDVQCKSSAYDTADAVLELNADGYYEGKVALVRYQDEWKTFISYSCSLIPPFGDENRARLEAFRDKYGPVEFPLE